jgi:hypothetical protein
MKMNKNKKPQPWEDKTVGAFAWGEGEIYAATGVLAERNFLTK